MHNIMTQAIKDTSAGKDDVCKVSSTPSTLVTNVNSFSCVIDEYVHGEQGRMANPSIVHL